MGSPSMDGRPSRYFPIRDPPESTAPEALGAVAFRQLLHQQPGCPIAYTPLCPHTRGDIVPGPEVALDEDLSLRPFETWVRPCGSTIVSGPGRAPLRSPRNGPGCVPTVLRSGPCRFYFYSHEASEPPHVHVDRDAATAKFWLTPPLLASTVGFGAHELGWLLRLIRSHRRELLDAWNAVHT
ncbi:MAG: DUF4160 domain-containing protein [Longimicrobiales bacterium]